MADNVAITAGSGTTVRTQDKGGAHVQVVQVDVGDDTTVTPLVLGQAAAAASVPVVIASDQGALTVGSHAVTNAGTFAVQESGGVLTALQIMDDWDETDRCKVNPISGQAGVAANTGARSATTQRVTIANDDELVRIIIATGSTLTRPANTTAYAANDSVSDNATAGSVTANTVTISGTNDYPVGIASVEIASTDTGPSTASAIFRMWVYRSDPTASSGVVGGDNAAFSNKNAGFVGTLSGVFRAFSDGSRAVLTPDEGTLLLTLPGSGAKTLWWQLQTLTAFTPSANSTTFIPTFRGVQGTP